jgi:hypothetical protein
MNLLLLDGSSVAAGLEQPTPSYRYGPVKVSLLRIEVAGVKVRYR